MITFGCTNCFRMYEVPDDKAGMRGECAKCGEPLVVPARRAVRRPARAKKHAAAGPVAPVPAPRHPTGPAGPSQKPAVTSFRCPACSTLLKVPSALGGELVKCSKCWHLDPKALPAYLKPPPAKK